MRPQRQHFEPENRKSREKNNEEKCPARDEWRQIFPCSGVLAILISGDQSMGERANVWYLRTVGDDCTPGRGIISLSPMPGVQS